MNPHPLADFLTPDASVQLTPEEILRYLDGTMSPDERVELVAFLASNPAARMDVEDARRQLELDNAASTRPVSFGSERKVKPSRLVAITLSLGAAAFSAVVACALCYVRLAASDARLAAVRLERDEAFDNQRILSERARRKEEEAIQFELQSQVKLEIQAQVFAERKRVADLRSDRLESQVHAWREEGKKAAERRELAVRMSKAYERDTKAALSDFLFGSGQGRSVTMGSSEEPRRMMEPRSRIVEPGWVALRWSVRGRSERVTLTLERSESAGSEGTTLVLTKKLEPGVRSFPVYLKPMRSVFEVYLWTVRSDDGVSETASFAVVRGPETFATRGRKSP